jgi:hypothetical protein
MWAVPESAEPTVELPASAPPPWPAAVRATLWWHRASPDARTLGPSASLPVTVGMVVDYLSSPVGPYREVLASPVLRRTLLPTMAVPFIAVDSPTSAHGGRVHWDLPKTLAVFTGDVTAVGAVEGEGWHVRTSVRPLGPRLPVAGAIRFAQPVDGGLGVATVRMTGRFRLARVDVDSSGPTLPGWLTPGTHTGVTVSGRMTTGPQRRR